MATSFGRLNNRTHRKLLVVDGRIGFTGGVGIADVWSGNAQDRDHWRDTHYRIEGPAVAQMQSAFHDNWVEVTGAVLHGPDYYPRLRPRDRTTRRYSRARPAAAEKACNSCISYRSPRPPRTSGCPLRISSRTSSRWRPLSPALKRGVKIQIILPGPVVDADVVPRVARRLGPLLRAGAEIYEYQPTMFHCKVLVVDDVWTSVGSTNFDNRSFSINDEANLNVYDREFARMQSASSRKISNARAGSRWRNGKTGRGRKSCGRTL